MTNILDPDHNEYLNDGVYVSYDGYQIWLAVDNHANKVVALDSDTYAALKAYVERLKAVNQEAYVAREALNAF